VCRVCDTVWVIRCDSVRAPSPSGIGVSLTRELLFCRCMRPHVASVRCSGRPWKPWGTRCRCVPLHASLSRLPLTPLSHASLSPWCGAGACPCLLAWLGVVWGGPCVHNLFSPRAVTSTRHRSHPILPAQEADDGSSAVALIEKMVGASDPPVDVILMDYIMVRRALHTCLPLQYDPAPHSLVPHQATHPHTSTFLRPTHSRIPVHLPVVRATLSR